MAAETVNFVYYTLGKVRQILRYRLNEPESAEFWSDPELDEYINLAAINVNRELRLKTISTDSAVTPGSFSIKLATCYVDIDAVYYQLTSPVRLVALRPISAGDIGRLPSHVRPSHYNLRRTGGTTGFSLMLIPAPQTTMTITVDVVALPIYAAGDTDYIDVPDAYIINVINEAEAIAQRKQDDIQKAEALRKEKEMETAEVQAGEARKATVYGPLKRK